MEKEDAEWGASRLTNQMWTNGWEAEIFLSAMAVREDHDADDSWLYSITNGSLTIFPRDGRFHLLDEFGFIEVPENLTVGEDPNILIDLYLRRYEEELRKRLRAVTEMREDLERGWKGAIGWKKNVAAKMRRP